MVVRGKRRPFLFLHPANRQAAGLVVELHGSGLDPQRQVSASGLAQHLHAEGYALLVPRALMEFQLEPAVAPGFAWNVPGSPLPSESEPRDNGPDDIGDIASMVGSVLDELGQPDLPLYLVGYSGGGRLASEMMSSKLMAWRAAAIVAGLRLPKRMDRVPPPVLSFHGIADRLNPFYGSSEARWDLGVEEAARRVAASQGCTELTREAMPDGYALEFRSPTGRLGVRQVCIEAASHAWPGSSDRSHRELFGPCAERVDASRQIVSFFSASRSNAVESGDGRSRSATGGHDATAGAAK